MTRHLTPRSGRMWFVALLLASTPLLFALIRGMWFAPYPISETVALMDLAGVMDPSVLSAGSGLDPRVQAFFDPAARAWYRPLYHFTWWAFWRSTGSLAATLFLFKMLEAGSALLLLGLFLWRLRPKSFVECAAASFALAVLVGTPGFRDNLEQPLLYTLVGMPLMLIVWMLLERERRGWYAPVIVVLTMIAVGYKEQGLVMLPLVLAAWWTGAPGCSRTTTLLTSAACMAYLIFRFTAGGAWPPFGQDIGLGFSIIPASTASERFGGFPFWVYAYNAISTAANVLFSEPTAGVFTFVRAVRDGHVEPWQINHLVSSIALTAMVTWWGIGVWKRDAGGIWTTESRVVVATVVAVAASGALGFNYARDRLGGMAVVFYAIAAFYAMRAGIERAIHASRGVMVAASLGLLLLAGAWNIRALGTVENVRVMADKSEREWLADLQSRRTEFARQTGYLQILEAMVPQGTRPLSAPPRAYPEWVAAWLGANGI